MQFQNILNRVAVFTLERVEFINPLFHVVQAGFVEFHRLRVIPHGGGHVFQLILGGFAGCEMRVKRFVYARQIFEAADDFSENIQRRAMIAVQHVLNHVRAGRQLLRAREDFALMQKLVVFAGPQVGLLDFLMLKPHQIQMLHPLAGMVAQFLQFALHLFKAAVRGGDFFARRQQLAV